MSNQTQIRVRLDHHLIHAVERGAAASGRSFNSEVSFALGTIYLPGAEIAETSPAMNKNRTLTVRLTDEVHARLQSAAKLGPYEISLTTIVERGIELAAQELERMAAKS